MTRVTIDPVTRINGPLRIEAEVEGGVVSDAWSAGTMYRGIEGILEGRDPRGAWLVAQRICGVCGGAHALASVRAVERAVGVQVPPNARLVRNLIGGSKAVIDHAAGFYLRHSLDWVDVPGALQADPAATAILARSLSDRPNATAENLRAARDRFAALANSTQPGFLANGYPGHPAASLPPEESLLVLWHYLEALDWQREMIKLQVILGGKSPHPQTWLMGGVALAASWGGPRLPDEGQHPFQMNRNSVAPLSAQGLADVGRLIDGASTFVEEVYLPDVLMLAEHYRDWSTIGLGIGHYLSFGEYPEDGAAEPALLLPRGRIMDRDLSHIVDVAESGVAESVAHSHYVDADGGALRHPRDGRTTPKYAGPTPPVSTLAGWDRYSWVKAPRYEDDPMETGPAARVMVAAAAGSARLASAMTRVTASGASTLVRSFVLGNTLGRTVARAIEAELVAERLHGWLDELHANMASGDLAFADLTKWDPATWPREAEGWAIGETAGGATGHWLRIEDRRIASYQVVDGTTWNASPRDRRDRRGAIEEALIGTPVADPGRPLEILRVIHSFDPCMAAAVH